MILGAGNTIESIIVGRPEPLLESAETVYDRGIQADSINKTQVPDQLVEFDMWTNDNSLETKVDSTIDSSILDGAKDTKKGNHWDLLLISSFDFFYKEQ